MNSCLFKKGLVPLEKEGLIEAGRITFSAVMDDGQTIDPKPITYLRQKRRICACADLGRPFPAGVPRWQGANFLDSQTEIRYGLRREMHVP